MLFRTYFHRDHRAPCTMGSRTPTVYSCQTGQLSDHTTAPFAAIPAWNIDYIWGKLADLNRLFGPDHSLEIN